jgi:flagellar motor switch protein FliG
MLDSVFTEFNELASSQLPIQIGHEGGTQFIRKVVSKAIAEGKAQTIIEGIQEEGKWNLFQKVMPHSRCS